MNVLKRDGTGLYTQVVGLAPESIQNISADTVIDHTAITVQDNVNIYFVSNPSLLFNVPAQSTIVVNDGLRLEETTVCLVY